MIPEVQRDWDGTADCRFDYDQIFLTNVWKPTIPLLYRPWNPAPRRTWTVKPPYVGIAIDILRRHFGDVHIVHAGQEEPEFRHQQRPPFTVFRGGAAVDPDLVTLHLRDDAPPELIDAAYRCLSKLHHPDKGGATETMQRLNAAYARLQDRQRGQGVA